MSTAQYTPGPWQVLPEEASTTYVRIRGTRLGGRYKVANVLALSYEGLHPREAEETRANARLIAAAPDLLAAARKAQTECVDLVGTSAGNALADAIAKATGSVA